MSNEVATIPPAYPHQVEGFQRALRGWAGNPSAYCLHMDMGTGKSRVAARVWWRRVSKREVDDLLIVAPKGCYQNWEGEFDRWFTPAEREHVYLRTWVSGAGVGKMMSLDTFLAYRGLKNRVLLMNVEALSRPGRAREFLEAYLTGRRTMWIIDEPACIMHWESERTKFVHAMAKHATHRLIATGMLYPEAPLNVFSQFWFLDPRILGHRDYYSFQRHYAVTERVDYRPLAVKEAQERRPRVVMDLYYHRQSEKSWQVSRTPTADPVYLTKSVAHRGDPRPGGFYSFSVSRWLAEDVGLVEATGKRGAEKVVGYRHLDELRARVGDASYRVEMSAALKLPPQVYMPVRWVEMTPEQARMYDEMRRYAATVISDQHASADTKMTQLIRLQQLICGHVTTEEGDVVDVPQNRVQAVLDVIADHEGKAVVWAPYPRLLRKIVDALAAEYGPGAVCPFWGETSQRDREEAKRRMQTDPGMRFIVANQAVGGEGNTWTEATLAVYAANGPKNRDRQQSERRNWRAGQTKPCVYVDLAVRGTIDEKWVALIREKMDLAATLTGDGWRAWVV